MEDLKANALLKKYLEGNCTDAERALVESWYIKEIDAKTEKAGEPDYQSLKSSTWEDLERLPAPDKKIYPMKHLGIAASIILCISIALFFYRRQDILKADQKTAAIVPGSNQAVLTLQDGEKIMLSEMKPGELARQGAVTISKLKTGELTYTVKKGLSNSLSSGFNTIVTPKGGEWQVNLPDGSRVWLNSASSLTFPTAFTGNVRQVQLRGEAYFEVAKNKAKPFKVITAGQMVEVLGTHFNINAYQDEAAVKTTLLEGVVRVKASGAGGKARILAPGQNAVLQNGNISISNADTEEAIAWHKGYMRFNNDNIESLMREIARWYDVEVVYEGNISQERFTGTFSRKRSIQEVLNTLQLTGFFEFKIEGRRIIVM
ncbi:FecR family protein [Desertivirga brevis]|uniref:FecR family protein n=1 Tax=Desertivirga brevis TaxID=2810310 RepID=UPI001A97921F|nr:FecR domain-containing protein [Pedobacter sp. SYSU D00873]